jgi:hypothetical protein
LCEFTHWMHTSYTLFFMILFTFLHYLLLVEILGGINQGVADNIDGVEVWN